MNKKERKMSKVHPIAGNINTGNVTKRISWVDNAKALGIILVFYGHIVEKIFLTYAIPTAGLQYKLF
jgi:uncharacterized membrane protein YcfT